MAKRGLITGGGGDGVDSYIDLENRPDDPNMNLLPVCVSLKDT
jgi:hypothetical protein